MEGPQIRPGAVNPDWPAMTKVLAFSRESAPGKTAIQLFTAMGVPHDRLRATPPRGIGGGQGIILSFARPETIRCEVESAFRSLRAEVHRQPG